MELLPLDGASSNPQSLRDWVESAKTRHKDEIRQKTKDLPLTFVICPTYRLYELHLLLSAERPDFEPRDYQHGEFG